jgi:regulator of sirC expression with transglutaminase-like and TPR domain
MDQELKALINLLNDTDTEVFQTVERKLIQRGIVIVPDLENAWESSLNDLFHKRIENVIGTIQFNNISESLENWCKTSQPDLWTGVYLVAKYQYPELDLKEIDEKLNLIRQDVWLEMSNNLTSLEKVKVLNHIIFDVHKFAANTSNFYAPQNSYINHVLDTKKGNSLILGVIYSEIARRLDLPVSGVILPNNFVLAYQGTTDDFSVGEEFTRNILFYINPYNKGAVLGKREIDNFLKQQKLEAQPSFYQPCANQQIISALLDNLIIAYEKLGYPEKISDLNKLYSIVKQYI